jgi:tRNA nucleotidyltransferase/poly(A) polymerase
MKIEKFKEITSYISEIIKGTEFENHVFAVGGSVRDYVMGKDIKDIDLVINLPQGGTKFAQYCKDNNLTHTVVIYETYGTAMFKFYKYPDEEIECVMTRAEKYSKGSRNPVTKYASLKTDAFRRDFTINALYYNVSTGRVKDVTKMGLYDIKNKIIRCPLEDVNTTFNDDPLRIMRCIRMATVLGFDIDKKTYEGLIENRYGLNIISRERIRDEFSKILVSKNPVYGVRTLCETKVMDFVDNTFRHMMGMEQNEYHFGDVYEHTMAVLEYYQNHYEPDLINALACICHDYGKIETQIRKDNKVHFYEHEVYSVKYAQKMLYNLKFDNKTVKKVSWLVRNHMRTKNFGNDCCKMKEKSFNKLVYECGTTEMYIRLCKLIECDNMSHAPEHNVTGQFDYFMKHINNPMFGYKLPISGDDIMYSLELEPCKEVQEIKDKLLKQAFARPTITETECFRQLPSLLKQVKNEKKMKKSK